MRCCGRPEGFSLRWCLQCVGSEPCSDALCRVTGSLRDLRGSGKSGFSQWRSQHIFFAVSGLHMTLSFLSTHLVTEDNDPLLLELGYQVDENERRVRWCLCQLPELGRAVTSTWWHAFSNKRIRTTVPERRCPQYLEFDAELSCGGQACFQGAPTQVRDTRRKLAGRGVQVPTSRLDVAYHKAQQRRAALGRRRGFLDARHLSPYSAELGYRFKLECRAPCQGTAPQRGAIPPGNCRSGR